MALNEHERAVREALRTNRKLKVLFGQLGTREHPRGRVLTAYRQARRALKGNVARLPVVRDVLGELRTTLAGVAMDALTEAERIGLQQARTTLAVYGLPNYVETPGVSDEFGAWMAVYDAQAAAVLALAAADDEATILGDAGRVGTLSPAPVVREGARWLAVAALASLTMGIDAGVTRGGAQGDYMRQAVAAIDERTTNCCLRVHGQVTEIRGKFTLTGTPRWADKMTGPPFHNFCRTSVALVHVDDVDDELSVTMRQAGRAELAARKDTGEHRVIHPASATSRR